MKKLCALASVVLLALLMISIPPSATVSNQTAIPKDTTTPDDRSPIQVTGRTQATPGRKALIAPVPLHPVEEVLVVPGDRVKKDQLLVKIDDDEPRADVRAKEAALANAELALKEARRLFEMQEKTFNNGALSMRAYHESRATALKSATDVLQATAVLENAKAELDHYYVKAQIDGVISWLDVQPGMVSRPGTTVWGEILDLSVIDVRCDLTSEQADRVTLAQTAEIHSPRGKLYGTGSVVYIGISADEKTGLVPVTLRLPNPEGALRCAVSVHVRFNDTVPQKVQR